MLSAVRKPRRPRNSQLTEQQIRQMGKAPDQPWAPDPHAKPRRRGRPRKLRPSDDDPEFGSRLEDGWDLMSEDWD